MKHRELNPSAVRSLLEAAAEPAYLAFASSLIPGEDRMLGVRLPAIRALAQEIARGEWREYLAAAEDGWFEETMLRGMVIGAARAEMAEKLPLIREFIPKISNWSVCDSFCASLKSKDAVERALLWEFIRPCFRASGEYEVRFALVMGLFHYCTEEYIDRFLSYLAEFSHRDYYAQMAAAWALSVCYVHFPEKTFPLLEGEGVDDFTRRKALQKILESRRVSPEGRAEIIALRKIAPRRGAI